jgi:hypothetical protein
VAQDLQESIRWMSQTNPTWGALCLVGELRKLGLDVAKSTVEKYRIRRGPCPQHGRPSEESCVGPGILRFLHGPYSDTQGSVCAADPGPQPPTGGALSCNRASHGIVDGSTAG